MTEKLHQKSGVHRDGIVTQSQWHKKRTWKGDLGTACLKHADELGKLRGLLDCTRQANTCHTNLAPDDGVSDTLGHVMAEPCPMIP